VDNGIGWVQRQRGQLHFDALVGQIRQQFEKLADERHDPQFSLADTLMAGLALFALKDPSLLAFQRRGVDHNLGTVFGLKGIPSDTQMRSILDEVDPARLRPAFRHLFRRLQRGKALEGFVFLQGCYLLALDGVEYHCSEKVHCQHCLSRQHRGGGTSYYHQLLGAALIHPDFPEVIPLFPEFIQRPDGQLKNDCEGNAARRWVGEFRREHPHLPVLVVEDALSSNAPHLRDLKAHRLHFLLAAKRTDHAWLFEQYERRLEADGVESVYQEEASGASRSWLFVNGLSLNESNPELLVNLLVLVEVDAEGAIHEWSWVTDLTLRVDNVVAVSRGGRARWRIENETFNTLKNQGYHFEHNFGHGEKHLAGVFAVLMMLAFLIDQVQQRCNGLFRQAWQNKGPKKELWDTIRHLFASFLVSSMAEIYQAIAQGYHRPQLRLLIEPARSGRQPIDTS
jgi:hypothetical protein